MGAKTFLGEHLCALHVFLCALVSRPVWTLTRAQLRGNIGTNWSDIALDTHLIRISQT